MTCRTITAHPAKVSGRLYRWHTSGLWNRILSALQAEADARGEVAWDLYVVNATIIRAHQQAADARRDGAIRWWGPGQGGTGPQPA